MVVIYSENSIKKNKSIVPVAKSAMEFSRKPELNDGTRFCFCFEKDTVFVVTKKATNSSRCHFLLKMITMGLSFFCDKVISVVRKKFVAKYNVFSSLVSTTLL